MSSVHDALIQKLGKYSAFLVPAKEVLAPKDRLNPFPWFEKMLRESPIRYDSHRMCWDLFGYDDVVQVLQDPYTFSSQRFAAIRSAGFADTLLDLDPPKHTQMRMLVSKAFTPNVIAKLAPKIESVTNELLDQVIHNGRMDIVHDLAVPMPIIIIAELLGIPSQDRMLFKNWSHILVKGPKTGSLEEATALMQERMAAREELSDYFREVILTRKKQPQGDLISILIQSHIDGVSLTVDEIITFCILLLLAGNETTTNFITNAIRCFLDFPKALTRIREDISLLPGALEEVLRFYPPVHITQRIATKDIQMGEFFIREGQMLCLWMGASNRDERKFPNANTFTIDRSPNPHLTFGLGNHFCLGAPLARLEGKIAISTLLTRLQNIKYEEGIELNPVTVVFAYGVESLPIRFEGVEYRHPMASEAANLEE